MSLAPSMHEGSVAAPPPPGRAPWPPAGPGAESTPVAPEARRRCDQHAPRDRCDQRDRRGLATLLLLAAGLVLAGSNAGALREAHAQAAPKGDARAEAKADAASRPALSVTLVTPAREAWPQTLVANGNVAAWQEAAVGAELSGLRITAVLVNVGDRVRKGQPLARVNAEVVQADRNQARAAVAEAEAVLGEARANAERARDLAAKGFLSPQAAVQSATAEQTATARLAAAQARLRSEDVRISQTQVLAPDDGTISARNATVGALTQPGQELFRLIRGDRLEWRAEVTAAELARLAPGLTATVRLPGGGELKGRIRTIGPTVDPQTRNAIVYVDLPASPSSPARAGMFARGEFELGRAPALTLPQSAVVQREGFAYAFVLEGGNRVAEVKLALGRRLGDRVEVLQGLSPQAQVVASGAGFLAHGDVVRVVSPVPTPPPVPTSAPAPAR